jgi:galactose mutarotase-like enzyme
MNSPRSRMISISYNNHSATFLPERGATMSSLVLDGHEMLYCTDDFDTNDQALCAWPFCFPTVGRLSYDGQAAYHHKGQLYELPMHGFARFVAWEVLEHKAAEVTFVLTANDDTWAVYPFDFEVRLTYQLRDTGLVCYQKYSNHGTDMMPYAAGFHPYFLIEDEKADVEFSFESGQRYVYNDALNHVVGRAPAPASPTALSNPDINERLLCMGENKATSLQFPDGRVLTMSAEGVEDANLFPFVQTYHEMSEPFFCIEPWMSYPNAMNSATGMRLLKPGQSEQGVLTVQATSMA